MTTLEDFCRECTPQEFWSKPLIGKLGGKLKEYTPKPKPGIWPAPVYEAHYSDGSTLRMSFWSAKGKPIDPTRGRSLCSHYKTPINGFVDHGGTLARDPYFEPGTAKAKPRKSRQSINDVRKSLKRVLALIEGNEALEPSNVQSIIEEARSYIQ